MTTPNDSKPVAEQVTKAAFQAYERVRRSGQWNMLMDCKEAARAARLSKERYWAVFYNYNECAKKWKKSNE